MNDVSLNHLFGSQAGSKALWAFVVLVFACLCSADESRLAAPGSSCVSFGCPQFVLLQQSVCVSVSVSLSHAYGST